MQLDSAVLEEDCRSSDVFEPLRRGRGRGDELNETTSTMAVHISDAKFGRCTGPMPEP